MLRAAYRRFFLDFKEPAVTSRSVMTRKETFLLKIYDTGNPGLYGVGEIPLFRGLSAEDTPDFENILADFADNYPDTPLPEISSVRFGVESALADMERRLHPVTHSFSYPINGLVWMGDREKMFSRIKDKLESGFRCLKLKIGGIDFEEEISLLKFIRGKFGKDSLELRLDANGAFLPENALEKLGRLAPFCIHSIEQPVKQGQRESMRKIIASSPIPVALDEEIIGFTSDNDKVELLDYLNPHYIILKPALCGGFSEAEKWIAYAAERGIGWWATSALESNIGLTAIAMWLRKFNVDMPQGLGTGMLYKNNFHSPLSIEGERLVYHPEIKVEWNF